MQVHVQYSHIQLVLINLTDLSYRLQNVPLSGDMYDFAMVARLPV